MFRSIIFSKDTLLSGNFSLITAGLDNDQDRGKVGIKQALVPKEISEAILNYSLIKKRLEKESGKIEFSGILT